ncbi:Monothiol glutaredoxin- chloroplastic [Chlorella sorokiniana]|uniref:Monothiol glutaredoxin-chloroplastic n=1 Tax=Chlorella sorokiniana TaxID=3076 RepID=A0A2P6TE20_CHLSO|nr:Monothiol glutaredoxin- chloroplastic [Chlorella sorokiniana]|eukprot:PRW20885.1 Monothiol glutaredoxin- chloroplastic [Chlorella sorokiniana]
MQALASSPAVMAPATAGRQGRAAAAAAAARPAAVLPRPQRRRVPRAAARRMVMAAADGAQQAQTFATTAPQRVAGADGKLAEFPQTSGVYAVYDNSGTLHYLGISRRIAVSLATHAEALPAGMVHSVKIMELPAASKDELQDAWKAWMQEAVAETGSIPPGNAPGQTLWQQRKPRAAKPEIRLTPGKGLDDLTCSVEDLIDQVVKTCKVVAFVKGTRTQPQCGFSYKVLTLLQETGAEFEVVNVLDDVYNPGLREAIKTYSAWPTIPQVFVDGEFIGGADIVESMYNSGELKEALQKAGAVPAMTVVEEEQRRLNLIVMLQEEAEDEGRDVPEPPADARSWSEEQIRAYFKTGGAEVPTANGCAAANDSSLADLAAHFPPPDAETFRKWFPGLALSRTACDNPRLRVLCFPNAGNAEDMYTSEGTGVRRAPSPLLDWCRANVAECLAVQPPGRNTRSREPPFTACRDLAAALLPVVASRLLDAPYVVVAHSVGTWVAYELLRAVQAAGLPMPTKVFLSAMASPDIPWDQRPWRQQRGLDEEQFKEECRGWDVNELVFSAALWGTYQPLMRADFTLFDEYEHTHGGQPPFAFPLITFWGSRDRRIKQHLVQGWSRFTTGAFELHEMEGHHLWPLDKASKAVWLGQIAAQLEQLAL